MPESVIRLLSGFEDARSGAMGTGYGLRRGQSAGGHPPAPVMPGGWPARSPSCRRFDGVRHAQVVVLGDDDLTGIGSACRALGVAVDLEGPEALLECVVGQETTLQRLAHPQQ